VALGLSPTFGALGSAPSAMAVSIASNLPLAERFALAIVL
jgi:hypothetical protein